MSKPGRLHPVPHPHVGVVAVTELDNICSFTLDDHLCLCFSAFVVFSSAVEIEWRVGEKCLNSSSSPAPLAVCVCVCVCVCACVRVCVCVCVCVRTNKLINVLPMLAFRIRPLCFPTGNDITHTKCLTCVWSFSVVAVVTLQSNLNIHKINKHVN